MFFSIGKKIIYPGKDQASVETNKKVTKIEKFNNNVKKSAKLNLFSLTQANLLCVILLFIVIIVKYCYK